MSGGMELPASALHLLLDDLEEQRQLMTVMIRMISPIKVMMKQDFVMISMNRILSVACRGIWPFSPRRLRDKGSPKETSSRRRSLGPWRMQMWKIQIRRSLRSGES